VRERHSTIPAARLEVPSGANPAPGNLLSDNRLRNALFLNTALNVLTFTCFFGARLILPLYALERGAPVYAIGLLAALLWVFPLLMAWPVGRLADRHGPHRLLALGFASSATGALVPFLVDAIPALYCSALLFGLSIAFSDSVQQGVVAQLSTPETRTRNVAHYTLFGGATTFTGPLLGGLAIDQAGHALACLMLIALPVSGALLLVLFGRLLPGPKSGSATSGRAPMQRGPAVWRLLWLSGVAQLGQDMFQFFLPVYGHSIGLSASASGSALALLAAAAFAIRSLLMRLVARFGDAQLLAGALMLEALCFALLPWMESAGAIMVVCFMFGLGSGCASPLTLLLTMNRAPEGRMSETVGLRLTFNNLVKLIGPAALGAVASAAGFPMMFGLNAALMFYAGVLSRRSAER
jgi:MFS family permease